MKRHCLLLIRKRRLIYNDIYISILDIAKNKSNYKMSIVDVFS